MTQQQPLPPGQKTIHEFPRFGLSPFATRFPKDITKIELQIGGDVAKPLTVSDALTGLHRVTQTSDFHCVTTWSHRALQWSGYLFSDFYEQVILPQAQPAHGATLVVFRCQDGYAMLLPLADLLQDTVLLADRLNGEPLNIAHGAPLRLVAPAHYGYKNAKHLRAIELWCDARAYRSAAYRFMDHPRARVALEERGVGVPGRVLRYLYRPLVGATIARFQRALDSHMGA